MAAFTTAAIVGSIRFRLAARRRVVTLGLLLTLSVLFALALYLGDYAVAPADIARSLLSKVTGATNQGIDFIVLGVRLPRALSAVLSGLAFGLSGIIFQTLLRNPLASPDIIGIAHGASAAAVFSIIILGWTGFAVSLGAFGGAVLTAALIYCLAWHNGVTAYRIVLIGIGMAAIMGAVTSYLFTRARLFEVQQALAWLIGSLNGARYDDVVGLALALVPLLLAVTLLLRPLETLQLGDDTAHALGIRVERARLGLLLVAVAGTAFATAAVGPVTFVAFVAGPIAKRLLGGAGSGLPQAGLVGAIVMLGSDLAAQHALPDIQLPVGVVTGIFGAIFLLWLLVATNRAGRSN